MPSSEFEAAKKVVDATISAAIDKAIDGAPEDLEKFASWAAGLMDRCHYWLDVGRC